MNLLKAGVFYFMIVFAAGFMLGTIRVLWIVPRLGTRVAELIEAPIMIFISMIAAGWLVRRFREITKASDWLWAGLTGLTLMMLTEFSVVLWLRGLSLAEYIATRDPVSSAVYFGSLVLFALLPLLLSRAQRSGYDEA